MPKTTRVRSSMNFYAGKPNLKSGILYCIGKEMVDWFSDLLSEY